MDDVAGSSYAVNYARFGRRFGAAIVDGFIIIFIWGILGLILDFLLNIHGQFSVLFGILYIAVPFYLYHAGLESSFLQATIGKKAFGMIVTDLNGNRISFGKASIRAIAQIIPFGYITILLSKKKQGLHDFIAGTLVIINNNLTQK
jgi:uncharacterized RDD family membrane protein YckC